MFVFRVLLYSSYTILVHLCEENGKVPFSFMAVNPTVRARFAEVNLFYLCFQLLLSAFMFMLEVAKANARPSAADESSVASVGSFFSALRERLRAEFSPHSPGYSTTAPSTVGSPVCHLLLIIVPFAVPAVLYTITNNLGLAIQLEMDPATYQARFSVPS
ncbi:unnamed protein product [Schistocephalus solidus]|uniref:Transmembrane protein n=1 Tax=Schistocephalus solidus TaxID=70667 RepID=A0A183T4J8_SCHSO|nr:unnamed protein product [Schistocephalus solidus]